MINKELNNKTFKRSQDLIYLKIITKQLIDSTNNKSVNKNTSTFVYLLFKIISNLKKVLDLTIGTTYI